MEVEQPTSLSFHRYGSLGRRLAVLALLGTALLQSTSGVMFVQSTTPDTTEEEPDGERVTRCRNFHWWHACANVETSSGARRRQLMLPLDYTDATPVYTEKEELSLVSSDDSSVVYDDNCLRRYRLHLPMNITFPYHANHLLRVGGNQTMALFIQHGILRNADAYYCSFRTLLRQQHYRPMEEILVIAPDFNYQQDNGVRATDAFWNETKPWGDWRVGAESDPECCSGKGTISSFSILDHMLGMLTDKALYPNMNKISFVGHSAGGQMVQRYALMSRKAAKWDRDHRVDIEFIVANPSSYTYLDGRRWKFSCGNCYCSSHNCTCDQDCTEPLKNPQVPDSNFQCTDKHYDDWPYGMKRFHHDEYSIPYVIKSATKHCREHYRNRHVVYMVGSNDTCNDALPTCRDDCWKRKDFLRDEWPCYRNHMDTRCPAMLEGSFRRQRGELYMKYLQEYYEEATHVLHVIEGVGHDATAMFGSPSALQELFD